MQAQDSGTFYNCLLLAQVQGQCKLQLKANMAVQLTPQAGSIQSPRVELTYSMSDRETKIPGKHSAEEKSSSIKLPKSITLSFMGKVFSPDFFF